MRKAPVTRDKVGTARFLLARVLYAHATPAHDAQCRAALHTILGTNSLHVRAWLLLAQLYARHACTHAFAVRCARRASHLSPSTDAVRGAADQIIQACEGREWEDGEALPRVEFEDKFLLTDSAMWLGSESEDDDDTANDATRM